MIPNEKLLKSVDQALVGIRICITELIEEHILIPSKYISHKYESLRGKMYTSDPVTKRLRCTYGTTKEVFSHVLSQDMYYAENGKTFTRIFIDNVLDERFYALPYKIEQMNGQSSKGFTKNPPYRKYCSLEE